MTYLILGLIIFFGAHLYTAFRPRTPEKDLKVKLGYGAFMGLYSLVSLVGLVLIVWGFGAARPAPILYQPPVWMMHINLLLMLPAMILLVSAYLPAGMIRKAAKHPMLVAIKIWAFGHLLANGELNSVLLFGSFLAFAVIDRIALKKRGDNGLPADAKVSAVGDLAAIVVGGVVYGAILVWLHPVLFGVRVLPG
ncbi:NnrU family protein [Hyphomonas sp. WL0036]|uniref:NnrU family protein n=1 Tax=Hyphomonas sediminis TaxID=2866160 RepID=UPI001C80B1C4|nr:NnrU family protein [Hyphomonas sediminis]MBY9066786.1 NnrU family protein [Hyphomonas sediminis]